MSEAAPTSSLRTLAWLIALPALGVALGYALLVGVVLERADLGDRQRIVELGRHLDSDASAPWLAFIGDSVTRDGIDAEIVEAHAPEGWHVENLGLSGAGLNERLVLLPKLLARHPDRVIVGLIPKNLWWVDPLPPDKASIYAFAGFVDAWPPATIRPDFPGIAEPSFAALRSTRLAQHLHLRTTPTNWLDHHLRRRMRSDLRSDESTDWVRPYTRLASIDGARLESHFEAIRADLAASLDGDVELAREGLREIVRQVRAGGAKVSLLVLPIHPALRDAVAPLLEPLPAVLDTVTGGEPGSVLDAHALLEADQFADALHPNADGREALSRFVGRQLPSP